MKAIEDGRSSQAAPETSDHHRRPRSQLTTELAAPIYLHHLESNSEQGHELHGVSQDALAKTKADIIAALDEKLTPIGADIAGIKNRLDLLTDRLTWTETTIYSMRVGAASNPL